MGALFGANQARSSTKPAPPLPPGPHSPAAAPSRRLPAALPSPHRPRARPFPPQARPRSAARPRRPGRCLSRQTTATWRRGGATHGAVPSHPPPAPARLVAPAARQENALRRGVSLGAARRRLPLAVAQAEARRSAEMLRAWRAPLAAGAGAGARLRRGAASEAGGRQPLAEGGYRDSVLLPRSRFAAQLPGRLQPDTELETQQVGRGRGAARRGGCERPAAELRASLRRKAASRSSTPGRGGGRRSRSSASTTDPRTPTETPTLGTR